MLFNGDGTQLLTKMTNSNQILQYDLTSSYDLTDVDPTNPTQSWTVPQLGTWNGIWMNTNGDFYINDRNTDTALKYTIGLV